MLHRGEILWRSRLDVRLWKETNSANFPAEEGKREPDTVFYKWNITVYNSSNTFSYCIYLLCVCHVHSTACVGVRGHLTGVGSLLQCLSWELNSGRPA